MISYVHSLKKGEYVGYNCIFQAKRNMKVAIIPIGFADAFMGLESNVGFAYVKKVKIIAICMDTMILDVTDINDIQVNDEVLSILSNRIENNIKKLPSLLKLSLVNYIYNILLLNI